MLKKLNERLELFEAHYDSAKRPHPLIEEFLALYRYRELVYQFVARSIKTRYKRSFLGIIWTLLNPLLTMIVLTVVFSQLFKFAIDFYPIYLLSGLVVWNFFSNTTKAALGDMLWSGVLLNRIYVPKTVFAVSALGTELINFLISFIPLILIALVLGIKINLAILLLPFSAFLVIIFSLGVGLILATTGVYFADMLPVYDVLLTIWMYATPIMYPLDILPQAWQNIFKYNPMYFFIETFRGPILHGVSPSVEVWAISIFLSLGTFLAGSYIFTSKSHEYAYRL